MILNEERAPSFKTYNLASSVGLLACEGKGVEMVRKMQWEYFDLEKESKGYSRWLWMSFHASLVQCDEPTCGGPPQLAALFGRGGGKPLGVYFENAAYVSGKPSVRNDLEYRDELFQRVDAKGIRLPNAQPHARMGKPRILKFAP